MGVALSVIVRVLIHPPTSAPSPASLYQPPSLTATVPAAMRRVTLAGILMIPLSLNTSAISPSDMPLAEASAGFIHRAVGSSSFKREFSSF